MGCATVKWLVSYDSAPYPVEGATVSNFGLTARTFMLGHHATLCLAVGLEAVPKQGLQARMLQGQWGWKGKSYRASAALVPSDGDNGGASLSGRAPDVPHNGISSVAAPEG
jgi:hypothetical protein